MTTDNRAKPLEMAGLLEWVIDTGLRGLTLEEQVEGFCSRLIRAGLPARRFNLALGTLHPIYGARTFVWMDGALVAETFERGDRDRSEYTRNPIYYMRKNGVLRLRQRLDTGEPQPYPLLDGFAAAGMTEYAARIDPFERPKDGEGPLNLLSEKMLPGVFLSCTTDAPGGFDEGHLAQLDDDFLLSR